ncbi:MAG: FumA C-terminus/TtdB family hydratase beta subunit [bacterium]
MKNITTPLTDKMIKSLKAGDQVEITGTLYTARDAAHKKIHETKKIPFPIKGEIIYYVGPTPARDGQIIGAAGPTTASRMDPYTEFFLKNGLKGMIGKGDRSPEVIKAIKKYKAVYFAAIGGAGALLSKYIYHVKTIAFHKLGTEAVRVLKVENFPVIVAIDSKGRNIYRKPCTMMVHGKGAKP